MGRSRRRRPAGLHAIPSERGSRLLADRRRIQQHRPRRTQIRGRHQPPQSRWADDGRPMGHEDRRIRTRRMDEPRRRHRGRHSTTHGQIQRRARSLATALRPRSGRPDLRVLHPHGLARLRLLERGKGRRTGQSISRTTTAASYPVGEKPTSKATTRKA
jgi:hypothetical protein